MYYSKLVFDPREKGVEVGVLNWDNVYQHHQFIWGLFPKSIRKNKQSADFIYKIEVLADTPIIHLVSKHPPMEKINRWQVTIEPWQWDIQAGELLQFSLRINPVVTIQGKRQDIFLHAKKSMTQDETRPLHQLLTDTGNEFLKKRANSWGVEFLPGSISFSNSQTLRGVKQVKDTTETKENISISMVDYQGLLKVTEPALLSAKLLSGFGHAKRFGCGLMLLKNLS